MSNMRGWETPTYEIRDTQHNRDCILDSLGQLTERESPFDRLGYIIDVLGYYILLGRYYYKDQREHVKRVLSSCNSLSPLICAGWERVPLWPVRDTHSDHEMFCRVRSLSTRQTPLSLS